MHLVHDLLDVQVLDRKRRPIGKVDGIRLELRPGRPPRIAAIEVGGLIIARRLHPRLGALAVRWSRWLGPAALHAVRIPWSAVRRLDRREIHVSLDATQSPLWTLERWLSRLYARIPGSGR